jgi:hypothetical protein
VGVAMYYASENGLSPKRRKTIDFKIFYHGLEG